MSRGAAYGLMSAAAVTRNVQFRDDEDGWCEAITDTVCRIIGEDTAEVKANVAVASWANGRSTVSHYDRVIFYTFDGPWPLFRLSLYFDTEKSAVPITLVSNDIQVYKDSVKPDNAGFGAVNMGRNVRLSGTTPSYVNPQTKGFSKKANRRNLKFKYSSNKIEQIGNFVTASSGTVQPSGGVAGNQARVQGPKFTCRAKGAPICYFPKQ